jgi:Domain of unknown function (DUF4440)
VSDATGGLNAVSQQILTAIRTRDRASLDLVLHADFVQINEAGLRTSRGAFIDHVVAADFLIKELSFEFLSVDAFEHVGVVCGVQRALVSLAGGEEVTARTSFTDVFVRNGETWQLRIATSSELP